MLIIDKREYRFSKAFSMVTSLNNVVKTLPQLQTKAITHQLLKHDLFPVTH
jgi:hypothetical protein